MKKMNVVLVYDKDMQNVLMCERRKDPYIGKLNLVGGKVREGENILLAAYRELEEETGIHKNDINLVHLMNFDYMLMGMQMEVYMGKLNKDVELVEEVNHLKWVSKDEKFYDLDKYAGEGNIWHMVKRSETYIDMLK